MIVTLNAADQFGDDGPQPGAVGIAHEVRRTEEDEVVVLVQFKGYGDETGYWCLLDHLLHAYTLDNSTWYSTLKLPDPEPADVPAD